MNKQILVVLALLGFTSYVNAAVSVSMHIDSGAGYPFACYRSKIDSAGATHFIEGKFVVIYYGFTKLTETEFLKTENPPWHNYKGEPVAAGTKDLNYVHDGGYKGNYFLPPFNIEVPAGWNLVYRLGYVKIVQGDCNSSPEQIKREYRETRVFFKELN